MPSQRQRASFEPVAPDFDVKQLVEATDNFQYVDRISCDMIDRNGMEQFDKLVLLHVVIGGKPLIIDGYEQRLDGWTFSSKWLQDNHGDKVENARNLTKKEALPLTIGHYLRNMTRLASQFFEKPDNYRDKDRQRIYLKDMDCPAVWQEKLREVLPPNLFYLNESSGEIGGPGAADEPIPTGGKRRGQGIASAGDLMSSLPPPMRAENLMCYIGHEGTYTPAHREMCASLGHNIMVEASDVLGDDGKPEKPGSSIWFMTETKDRQTVSEYWLSILGHDIEAENHFAQVAAWVRAPFSVYVVEQRPGDFLLIPPLAPHQVWNRGTRTMKVAWNRTTAETLEFAIKEALARARMVCRDEQYKCKATIFFTLQKYSGLLARARDLESTAPSPQEQKTIQKSPKIRQLRKDFKRLFHLFKEILLSEMFAPHNAQRDIQYLPFDSNVTCAYCRGNIFNRFLTCGTCDTALGTPEPEPYDVCMECYAMGRSCYCVSKLKWVEQFKWKELVQKYEAWRHIYVDLEGGKLLQDSPLPIQDEHARLRKHTLAQICQDQLKRRPWVDIKKPESDLDPSESEEDNTIEIGEDGTVKRKKKKKKRSEAWLKNNRPCHVCAHRHPKWKMAECVCGRWWCYGTLFRGHDLMPQQVMENQNWRCPHCENICSAGACRKDPRQNPYQPKGTLLGHDTRKVADVRSVESLVDFSVSNLTWLKESTQTPAENVRLRQKHEEALLAKANDPALHEHLYATDEDDHAGEGLVDSAPDLENMSVNGFDLGGLAEGAELDNIDPSLLGGSPDATRKPHVILEPDPGDDSPSKPAAKGLQRKMTDTLIDEVMSNVIAKKVRRDYGKSASGATKQYRKDFEKKAMEEARRHGRYIQVLAALKGKSKLVRLSLGREKLQSIRDKYGAEGDANILVRSDVQEASPKHVRRRVEIDEDFNTRKRERENQRKRMDGFEDFTTDDEEGDTVEPNSALQITDAGTKKRRVSSWQARRAQAMEEDSEGDADSVFDDSGQMTTIDHRQTAAAALRAAAGESHGEEDEADMSELSPEDQATPKTGSKKPKSILARGVAGPGGRKVKIVSGASRRANLGPGGIGSGKEAGIEDDAPASSP